MILCVIGGMLAHNFIIWRRKAILRRRQESHVLVRMTGNQRAQHILLGMGETFRRVAHRVAAVVLIGVGAYHLVYIALTREGRKLLFDFLPVPSDATDVWTTLRYYLGLGREKPQ